MKSINGDDSYIYTVYMQESLPLKSLVSDRHPSQGCACCTLSFHESRQLSRTLARVSTSAGAPHIYDFFCSSPTVLWLEASHFNYKQFVFLDDEEHVPIKFLHNHVRRVCRRCTPACKTTSLCSRILQVMDDH